MMRIAAAALLVLVGCAAAALAWGPLRNLFADYRDSPVSTYLLFGVPLVLVALGAFAGAWRLLRR